MDRDTVEPDVGAIPGERAREWVDYHHKTAAPSTYVYEFVWDHTAPAAGPFCTDVDGNVLMDFTGHVGAAPLGLSYPSGAAPTWPVKSIRTLPSTSVQNGPAAGAVWSQTNS